MAICTPHLNDNPTPTGARLRSMAAQLMNVADAIDSKGTADDLRLTLAETEREELLLTSWAEAEFKARQKRNDFFPQGLLGEPAWDMLLDLFIQHTHRQRVSVTNACRASGVASTTALRWLVNLEKQGIVKRVPAVDDKRVQFVELTKSGRLSISKWLRFRAALPV